MLLEDIDFKSQPKSDAQCLRQFYYLSDAFDKGEFWAIEWFNSWGQVPSGVFSGHFESVGSFQQCIRMEHFANEIVGNLKGQHCMLNLQARSELEIDDTFTTVANQFEWGNINPEQFCYTNEPMNLDARDLCAILFLLLIGLLLIVSTIYDVTIRKLQLKPHALYTSFSLLSNGEKLFEMNSSKSPESIECVNGIRGLSILWIMLGHRYLIPIFFVPVINRNYYNVWLDSIFSTFPNTSQLAVDTFLLMGGLLITRSFLTQKEKKGKVNLLRFYLHRYLRITPVLLVLVFIMVSFFRHFGDGPYHKNALNFNLIHCEKYWWATFLHIQNYFNPLELCLSHSWYLSADFQLCLASPLFLIMTGKFGRRSLIAGVVLIILSWGCAFSTFYKYDLSPFNPANGVNSGKFVRTLYATHIRLVGWVTGMILGYFLHYNKSKTFKVNRKLAAFLWIVSFSLIIAAILGHHPFQQLNENDVSQLAKGFYNSSARLGFVLAVSWIIFSCHQLKSGGIVNWFLSLPHWKPLGRMGLSFYLVHVFIQLGFTSYQQFPMFFSNFHILFAFFGDFVLTFFASTLLYLSFEAPILIIEQYLYQRFSK
ncbi:CLUMA_CG004260, isoform A [Clunio marinus]|uniref:CLUMA_CG004260, isoform A n=1 Tax=Clunio marinus TaxID=568069 RepID=A0A1J1HRA8_9DIPT|nr:CLUMA_CG004260, isoform A [Clunio marinus]